MGDSHRDMRTALNHRHGLAPRRGGARLAAVAALLPALWASAACAQVTGHPLAVPTAANAAAALTPAAVAPSDDTILQARDAAQRRDRNALAAAQAAAAAGGHPLLPWIEYWDLSSRLAQARQDELDAFYARWRGSYVEDRLRNDWLLELGRRQDWPNFARDYPRFRMNDDREVSCYAIVVDHLAGRDAREVREAGRAAWLAQRDADNGCALMARTLLDSGRLEAADVWRKARRAADVSRPRAAQQALDLLGPAVGAAGRKLLDQPQRYLTREAQARPRESAELAALALLRLATRDADAAARMMDTRWEAALPADLGAWVWASIGREQALRLSDEAPDLYQRAELRLAQTGARHEALESDWSDQTLAWKVRAALRASAGSGEGVPQGAGRWRQVLQGIAAMREEDQRDPAWVYWKARALSALAGPASPSEEKARGQREQADGLLRSIAGEMHFYGKLAADVLGQPVALPPSPAPLTAAERSAATDHPGLGRALRLIAIGLRNEGVREWNFSLRGMDERQLLAAAQRACDAEVWDRCINTSDRTKREVDMAQRFPMPHRERVVARAKEIGLDPAYVYGLIRQESRFIMDARSGAGASGLMQIMPATARWTARKIGLPYTADLITDRDTNILLGTSYLKLALDQFDGSEALAAAAYNAGPSRPRRWRQGPLLDAAAWTESIPFSETRDYVKKVLSNATYYAAMLDGTMPPLRRRLGAQIGPPAPDAPAPDAELP